MSQTETAREKCRRRAMFLIYPRFQIPFLAYSVLMTIIVTLIVFGGTAYFFYRSAKVEAFQENAGLLELLHRQQEILFTVLLASGLLSLVVASVTSLFFSNRLAGPVLRLTNHMKEIAQGRTDADIQFRQQDFFPEMAEAFNAMMASVRKSKGSGGA